MTKAAPAQNAEQLEKEALELIQNQLTLHPDEPASTISEFCISEADRVFVAELGHVLVLEYFTRLIKSARRTASPPPVTAPLFPELEHLPKRIVTPDGKRPLLAKSNISQVRAYLKSVNARHKEEITDLRAVLKTMIEYAREERGITVAEVAARIAKERKTR